MADKPTAPPEKVENPTNPAVPGADHTAKLHAEAYPGPSKDAAPKPKDVTEAPKPVDNTPVVELKGFTDVNAFNTRVGEVLAEAKATGKPIKFDVDNRTQMTDAQGKPVATEQSELLYNQLAKSAPERAFKFSKPDVNPGDPGYTEFNAPVISEKGSAQVSVKENMLTTGKEVKLADGSTLPPGSKFAVGTVYDGQTVKSIDPTAKVWATTPDGKMVQVADAGQSAPLDKADVALDKEGRLSGQNAPEGSRFPIKSDSGTGIDKKPLVDPDGKPLIDGNAIAPESFGESYKAGTKDGYFAQKGVSRDHFKLPENIDVHVETVKYAGTDSFGKNRDYYMPSGFADNISPTAKNYTGETDPRSAKELMRMRQETGIEGPTQVEAGLNKAMVAEAKATTEAIDNRRFNSDTQRAKFNNLADDLASAPTPEAKAQILDKAMKDGKDTQNEIAENRGESRYGQLETGLTTPMVELAAKAAEHGIRAPKTADVYKPGRGFHSSEKTGQHQDGASVPEAVAKAMQAHNPNDADREEIDKFMKEKGISPEEAVKVKGRFRENLGRGLPAIIALGAALGAAGSAMAATKDNAGHVTYGGDK
jgi:hypothetical protein